MKNIRTLSAFASSVLILSMGVVGAHARSLSDDVAGKILLQVEGHGEAWYVNPTTKQRHFLNRPADALSVMRGQGVGVTDSDLSKIPIGFSEATMGGQDTDKDGLTDAFEDALGTNKDNADTDGDGHIDGIEVRNGYSPFGSGKPTYDTTFAAKHKGKIFLQVQKHGEGWWVNPEDGKRYFLGGPLDAFGVMRAKALGISNKDLATIPEEGMVSSVTAQKTSPAPVSGSSLPDCAVEMLDKLASCTAYKCEFLHPLTGTKMVKEITGMVGGKCGYVETMPNNGKMTCAYPQGNLPAIVQYSRDTMEAESFGVHMTVDTATGKQKTTYTVNGKEVENPLQAAMDDGACVISGYDQPSATNEVAEATVTSTELESGYYVGPMHTERTLVSSQDELNKLWTLLHPGTEVKKPVIDFQKSHLLAVFGDREAYRVGITSLSTTTLQVFQENQPDTCPRAMSQPYSVVIIAKGSLENVNGYGTSSTKTEKCRAATPDAGTSTYVDSTYGFSVQLPDALKYFKVVPAPVATGSKFARVDFIQYSQLDDEDFAVFTIHVVPNSAWSDVENKGRIISWVSGSGSNISSTVTKLGSDAKNTYAVNDGLFPPDDLWDYDEEDVVWVK